MIEACLKILPEADSIAFFDSMFHSTMPDCVAKYAINQEVAGPKGLRKYGFHGPNSSADKFAEDVRMPENDIG